MKNAVIDCIYERKSVRAYTQEPVSDEDVEQLIDAAAHAANGMNIQPLRFSVVSNKDKLNDYSVKGKSTYLNKMKEIGFYEENLFKMLSNPEFDIFYGAPTAVFVFADASAVTPVEDVSLGTANMMLAAESLGLGTCWIGFAGFLTDDKGFVEDLKIPEGCKLVSTLIIGHPKNKAAPTPKNKPIVFSWLK